MERDICSLEDIQSILKRGGYSWFDLYGIDTTNYIKTKQEWINECKKNNVKTSGDYKILCENNENFPLYSDLGDFYSGYYNLQDELDINERRH